MKMNRVPILILLLSLIFSACGGSESTSADNQAIEPEPTETPVQMDWESEIEDGSYCAVLEFQVDSDEVVDVQTPVTVVNGIITGVRWPEGLWKDTANYAPIQAINRHAEFRTDKGIPVQIEVETPGSCD